MSRLQLSNDLKEHKQLVREFWKIVEDIVIQEYDEIKSMSMRDSFYHVALELGKIRGKEISELQYKYFWEQKTYDYYTQDKWSNWEKKHDIIRPKTKNYTVMIERGQRKVLPEDINDVYSRARGFIYVEKEGKANDLIELSRYGWVILGAQGQSQRLLREILKLDSENKPILVFHDADRAGELIKNVFIDGSKRTDHLDLKFDNIFDLGLIIEDAEELGLLMIPDPKGGVRCEINALLALKETRGLKNPFLWYVVTRMKNNNIPLCPKPVSKKERLQLEISWKLEEYLEPLIEKAVQESLEDIEDINVISIEIKEEITNKIENLELSDELKKLSSNLAKSAKDYFEADWERTILKRANKTIGN